MNQIITHELTIPDDCHDQRLDHALATLLPDYSRSVIKQWIDNQDVLVNGKTCKGKLKLHGGEHVQIHTELVKHEENWSAEAIPIDVVFEDDDMLVVNKPAGLVVHPAAGNPSGTLVNALLHHAPNLETLPRAGIIHRLDKDTSGLLLVAKSLAAHTSLVQQMQDRAIHREYCAIVHGCPIVGKVIETNMDRHPRNRLKMAVMREGKPAVTHYRVAQRFKHFTKLAVTLQTGRTHQIRVHLEHDKFPIIGDPLYGKPSLPAMDDQCRDVIRSLSRQALHAEKLGCTHPINKQPYDWHSPLPDDIQRVLTALENYDQV